jgi:hypothetical protein
MAMVFVGVKASANGTIVEKLMHMEARHFVRTILKILRTGLGARARASRVTRNDSP